MEDKRLDFDAPLLSVRRFSAGAAEVGAFTAPSTSKSEDSYQGTAARKPPRRRSSLPFYKSDLKSGPVRNPGAIPFVWEQTPGQPKDGVSSGSVVSGCPPVTPKLPPGRISNEKVPVGPRATAGAPVRIGSSVRTHKAATFASDGSTEKAPENPKGSQEEEDEKQKSIPADRRNDDDDEDEDDAFSDALDTLSRAESFFMNCSVSGLSGIPESAKPSGSFSADPHVRDLMMGRFLPAAQALATDSPHYSLRKAGAPAREPPLRPVERFARGDPRRPLPLPYQQGPNFLLQYAQGHWEGDSCDDEEEEEQYEESGHLPSKACGLLPRFCLKSSFCLINPVPGMKVWDRSPAPAGRRIGSRRIKTIHHGHRGQAGDEHSWEAVYRHKLGQRNQTQGEEGGSKLTGESNRLTCWSDSQTVDGSSPCYRSMGSVASPYQNKTPLLPFARKGFLGVPKIERKSNRTEGSDSCERDSENYWETTPHNSSQQGSCSMSPALEKTLYVDSESMPEIPVSKLRSLNVIADTRAMINSVEKNSEVGGESRRMEEIFSVETHEENASQTKVSEVVQPGLPSERPDHGQMGAYNNIKNNTDSDGPLPLEVGALSKIDVSPLQSLLPSLLLKSPSESWLFRTLPYVSSKNPPQSLLGLQFQPRKQGFQASSTEQKLDTNAEPFKPQHHRILFAEFLAEPISPRSEI